LSTFVIVLTSFAISIRFFYSISSFLASFSRIVQRDSRVRLQYYYAYERNHRCERRGKDATSKRRTFRSSTSRCSNLHDSTQAQGEIQNPPQIACRLPAVNTSLHRPHSNAFNLHLINRSQHSWTSRACMVKGYSELRTDLEGSG